MNKIDMDNLEHIKEDILMEMTVEELREMIKERGLKYRCNFTVKKCVASLLEWKRKIKNQKKEEFLNQHVHLKKILEEIKLPDTHITDYIRLSDCEREDGINSIKSNWDHIIELQLIKHFVSICGKGVPPDFIKELNTSANLQPVSKRENKKKGKLIRKVIEQGILTEEERESWDEYKNQMIEIIQSLKRTHVSRSLKKKFINYLNSL